MHLKNYDAILLLSGGIDSTTALYKLVAQGKKVLCLIFDYGQSLIKEVDVAKKNAERLHQDYKVIKIDLSFSGSKCSLISHDTPIATGRTFDQIDGNIPTSYVEFRNGILLSYAVMVAECNNIGKIYGGFNGLHSGQYYDDTMDFVKAFEVCANKGTKPSFHVEICAPFANVEKSEIVKQGIALGVDYGTTWSCYRNGEEHCGACDSCKQRQRALEIGGYYVHSRKDTGSFRGSHAPTSI